jgi:hypothetical protein
MIAAFEMQASEQGQSFWLAKHPARSATPDSNRYLAKARAFGRDRVLSKSSTA